MVKKKPRNSNAPIDLTSTDSGKFNCQLCHHSPFLFSPLLLVLITFSWVRVFVFCFFFFFFFPLFGCWENGRNEMNVPYFLQTSARGRQKRSLNLLYSFMRLVSVELLLCYWWFFSLRCYLTFSWEPNSGWSVDCNLMLQDVHFGLELGFGYASIVLVSNWLLNKGFVAY